MKTIKWWIVTMGGVGYLPASGTFASLLTCLILWPLLSLAGPSLAGQTFITITGTLLFSVLNIQLAPWSIQTFQSEDPGKFVLDEAAGICLTMVLFPVHTGSKLLVNLLAAFIGFRIFDITKIPPARQLENLPSGWGILLDDLAAAIYANILCQIVLRLILHF